MLALTPNAADAVNRIVSQADAPEGAIMRITSSQSSSEEGVETRDLRLSLVEAAEEEDLVVQGIPISVEPETAEFLDDKVLDAELDERGVQFSLYSQPPGGGPDPSR